MKILLSKFYLWKIGKIETKMDNESNENKAFNLYIKMESVKTKYHNL